jgi:hypothetical protein
MTLADLRLQPTAADAIVSRRMRCWERGELDMLLARHGFGKASFVGAYDPHTASGATDQLVVVAQRLDA